MITVAEADTIISAHVKHYGNESVPFEKSMGRVLAEDIVADRDLPPYDRVTMDGIAIRHSEFAAGTKQFKIAGTQAAGDTPIETNEANTCVEIMTGAALPESFDT